MQRMGMVIRVKPDMVEEYKRLHVKIPDEIEAVLAECKIRNYSIFLKEPENLMFGYWEYHGDDIAKEWARMAASPANQEWWKLCGPCMEPMEHREEGEWWAAMEQIFYLP